MVKKKIKQITAFVMTLCLVGGLPDYSLMTVYAAGPTTVDIADQDKDVFVAEDAAKATADMPNEYTISFDISNAPDEGAYLAFDGGDTTYADSYVSAEINNTNNTITFTGVSQGLCASLPVYAYNSSTHTAVSATATEDIDIYVCRSFDEDTVTVTPGDIVYTGAQAIPAFTVTDNTSSANLALNNHYNVLTTETVTENGTTYDKTTAGTQKVILRAVNDALYYGDYTATYTITQEEIADAIAGTTVVWSDDGVLDFTGSAIEPTSTDGDAEEYFTITGLTEGTDYEITGYSNNLSVGTASINVAGLGNYGGTSTINFIIKKDLSSSNISISFVGVSSTTITYDGTEHILAPTVRNNTDSTNALTEGTDYILTYEDEAGTSYSYDDDSTSPTYQKYIDGSGNEYDFTNVGTKKAVITAVPGSNYVNSGSIEYTIVSKDITDCIAVSSLPTQVDTAAFRSGTVDGLVVTADGTSSGTALTKDTDYTVTVTVNDDGDAADILVTGIGNYGGRKVFQNVKIGRDISTATITLYSDDGSTNYPYVKGGVTPSFDVTYGYTDLTENVDYTATITNNTTLGTATLTVQGMGDYAGTVTTTFTIVAGDLLADDVSIAMDCAYLYKNNTSVYFNGAFYSDAAYAGTNALTPDMVVTQGTSELEVGEDYSVSAAYALTSGYESMDDGVSIGTYTVTITGLNNYAGSVATKQYRVYKNDVSNTASMSISMGASSFGYTGSPIVVSPEGTTTKKLTVAQAGSTSYTLDLTNGTDYAISYVDSNGDEFTYDNVSTSATYQKYVNDSGAEYDFTSVGTKTIKVTGKGAFCGSETLSYTVSGVSIARGTFAISDKTYTGSAVTLDGTEFTTATVSGVNLTYGTDFEVVDGSYTNNVDYGNGTASVTIQGIGNYNGTKTVSFYIKKDVNHSDVDVTYTNSWSYTGSAIEPDVVVTDGTTTLTEGTDYTVAYNNNTDCSNNLAEIIITGAGESYLGTRTEYFTITRYTLSDIDDPNITYDDTVSYVFDGTAKRPTLTDLDFKFAGSAPAASSYTLTYEDNVDAGTAYAIFTPKSTSDLSGSVAIPFTITAKPFNSTDIAVAFTTSYSATTYSYTGSAVSLAPRYFTVTDSAVGSTLSRTTDYTVSYINNVNAADASGVNELYNSATTYTGPIAVITGTGNYSGTWYLGYTINQYDVGTKTFTTVADTTTTQTYDGTEKTPSVTVRIATGTLTAGTDYTITYTNNVNAGTGTYTIDLSASGNFKDSTKSSTDADYLKETGNFTINPRDLSEISITGMTTKTVGTTTYLILPNQEETGSAVVPELDAYYEANSTTTTTLTLNTDYKVTASGNNVNPNTNDVSADGVALTTTGYPYITISADEAGLSGNYTGSLTLYFNIRKGIRAEWYSDVSNLKFTGKAVEPEVVVYYGDSNVELTEGTDYTVTYDGDINARDASGTTITHYATITGIGDYGGNKKLTFTLSPIYIPTEEEIDSGSYYSSANYTVYGGYPCRYFRIVGREVSYIGSATNVDVTDMFGTTILFYPDGDALTNPDATNAYDIVANGNVEDFTVTSFSDTSAGFVTAWTRLTGSVHNTPRNFFLPGTSNYEITLTLGARSLGDQTSYADYITVDDIANQSHTGSHISLSGAVHVYDKYRTSTGSFNASARTSNFYELVEGTDYVLTYPSNAAQSVGENTVYIAGTGDYTGTITKTYNVVSSIATATVSAESKTYNGEPQTPDVVVTVSGETLTADVDYTFAVYNTTKSVNYGTSATEAGTYIVVVTGIGSYAAGGSLTKECSWNITRKNILDSDVSIRGISSSYTFDGTNHKPVPTVYYGSTLLTKDTDYTVTYSDTDCTQEGSYRVTVTGIGNFAESRNFDYTVGSNFIEDTNSGNIHIDISNATLTYDGTDRTDDIGLTVSLADGTVLTEAVYDANGDYVSGDYTYQVLGSSGELPVNAGTYTAYISGTGTYSGLIEKTITIEPEDITALTLGAVTDVFYYDGAAKEPTPTVTWNGNDVTSAVGTDFVYQYSNNINATEPLSQATVTLVPTLSGNFTDANGDMVPVTFDINPRIITDNDDIEITISTNAAGNVFLQYSGTTPTMTVVDNGLTTSPYTMVSGTDYTFEFSNNTGVSSANSPAVLTITGTGNYTGTKSKTFYIEKYPMSDTSVFFTNGSTYEYTGHEITPDIIISDADGVDLVEDLDYTVSYSDNVNVGTVTVTFTATEDSRFTGTTSATFTITPRDINDADITVEPIENYLVNQTPEVELSLFKNDPDKKYTLVQGTDFTVVASGNTAVTVDDPTLHATATITGTGNFTGTRTENYEVGHDISEFIDADIEAGLSFEYDETAKEPEVTVTMKTATSLVEAVYDANGDYVSGDYKIVYDDSPIDVGTYSVKVVGVGNYGGYITCANTYAITEFDITNAVTASGLSAYPTGSILFDGDVKQPEVTITVSIAGTAHILVQDTDFTVTYDDTASKDVGTYTYSITATGNYTGTVTGFEYTIEPKDFDSGTTVNVSPDEYAYTGSEITPTFAIVDSLRNTSGGVYRVTDTGYYTLTTADYVIYSISDNIYPGTATVTPIGSYDITTNTGNYCGGGTAYTFEIVADASTDLTVEAVADQAYTGLAIEPTPAVSIGSRTLTEGTDFTYSYTDNVDVGTATISVTPVDTAHYTGVATATFNISRDLSNATMTLPYNDATSYYYTGSAVTFTTANPVVVQYGGTTLTAGTDYTLTYTNNVNAGTATVTATAVAGSGYTGSISRNYTIVKRSLSASATTISLSQSTFDFTGDAITVENYVTVKYGSTTLTYGTDYTLTYTNNVSAGTATVKAVGTGLYSGSISTTFTIKATTVNINSCTVTWDSTVTYTGKATSPSVSVTKGSTTLQQGTDYTVQYVNNVNPGVASIRISGEGNFTSVKTVPYKIEVPDMGSVKVKKTSDTSVKLSWSSVGNVTGYVVYDTSDLTKKLATIKGTSGTVKNLTAGKKYNLIVRAYVDANGSAKYGSFSSAVTAVTKPKKPSISVSAGAKKATVKWKKVSSATGYLVYRSTSKNGSYKKVKTITKNSTLKYVNKKLTSGKTYYYKVRSYKTIDGKKYYSSYSKVKKVKVK
ncbi:MAG: fibronectin type III domain-containing protein [Lachnospiraceae bacterium]|nr:fibronectin type III domain-containing protein [Lachnospiraceae bacterium]